MLNIRYEHISKVGSCNLCSRGKLNETTYRLDFPYNHVYIIRGNSVAIVICRECMKELKEEC